jgi:hypothetical protein
MSIILSLELTARKSGIIAHDVTYMFLGMLQLRPDCVSAFNSEVFD